MSVGRLPSVAAFLAVGLTASVFTAIPALGSASASVPAATPSAPAAVTDGFRALPGFELDVDSPRLRVQPESFTAYEVDLAAAAESLATAAKGSATFSVPDPDGQLVSFELVEDPVLESELAAAHPEIRTYAGRATDGSGRTGRFDVTPLGFHALVSGPQGSWYVDPAYDRRDETRHISYYTASVPAAPDVFLEKELESVSEEVQEGAAAAAARAPGDPVVRRTYRMAFVTDPTYAEYFGSGNVLAAKTTLINRVNQLYNDDMAIKFVLINKTPMLNLNTELKASGANQACGANPCYDKDTYRPDGSEGDTPDGCSGALLDRTTFVLGQIVGAESFDIGHIGLGVNGGGIAALGGVGGFSKAEGCTGLPMPTGDFYAVDYFAHEVGHQMGGPHTFNGTQHNCAPPNRNTFGGPYTSQVEPGSGSTVMAYAGICRQDNLQPHSDPYFSFSSIEDIQATVAEDDSVVDERQVISFRDSDGGGADTGFDNGESITLTCSTPCGGTVNSVTVTNDAAYETPVGAAAIADKLGQLTGFTPVVGDYDDSEPVFGLPAGTPSNKGFTAEWGLDGTGEDIPRLVATPGTGTMDVFVGVTRQGGETTNEGTTSATGNNAPSVTVPADKTLPIQTPFTLAGSGSDQNGDDVDFLWEQTDPGGVTGIALADNNKFEGPLFRVFGTAAEVTDEGTLQSPSPGLNLDNGNPSRTFPDMAQILAGHTNAKTGTCPAAPDDPNAGPDEAPATPLPPEVRDCYSEFLPTQQYADSPSAGEMNFRLTARDQFPTGGGIATGDVTLTLDSSAGPFLVTSRETEGKAADPGGTEKVTWDVAGTDTPDLAEHVRILLSIDGGASFPVVLAAKTPNDGSHEVTFPKVNTPRARIKIEAVGNYFFDVNDSNFTIGKPRALDTLIVKGPAKGSFVKSRKAKFKLASTVPGSTFRCTMDGKVRRCGDVAKMPLKKQGTHVFKAAARTPAGVLDSTPAKRPFASPFNDTKLKRGTGGWTVHKDKRSYRGTYSETSQPGRVLRLTAKQIKKLALVAHTGPGFGRVAVFLGKDLVKTIDLDRGKKLRKKVLLKVDSFPNGRSGTVRIVTLNGDPVRIDGLGILTRTHRR